MITWGVAKLDSSNQPRHTQGREKRRPSTLMLWEKHLLIYIFTFWYHMATARLYCKGIGWALGPPLDGYLDNSPANPTHPPTHFFAKDSTGQK